MEQKPSEREDEYFAQLEFDRKKKAVDEHQQKLNENEKKDHKDLHYMRCPECGMQIVYVNYRSIKIHKCTECEGIWLAPKEFEAISNLDKSVINKFFCVFKK